MKNTKILLVNPSFIEDGIDFKPNYGLLALATVLNSRGHNVEMLNLREYNKKEHRKIILSKLNDNVFCVGISTMTAQIESALFISKLVKQFNKKIKVVWGGYHPSLYPIQTLKDTFVDFVIQGEGDYSFLELIECLKHKKNYSKIDGLGFKKRKKIHFNPQTKFIDLNELPNWNWDFVDVEKFCNQRTFIKESVRLLPYQSSRGCPYQCTFCINTAINCYRRWRSKNVNKIIDELETLIKKYNIYQVNFRDEIFFLTKKKVNDLCDKILEKKLRFKWFANSRVNFFEQGILDDNLLAKMKRAGCVYLSFGVESGSKKILKLLKKYITPQQALLSAKMCNKHGIIPIYSFILGLPTETGNDRRLSYNLMKTIIQFCPSSIILGPHLYRPYPGCELYNIIKKYNFLEARSLREWPDLIKKGFQKRVDPIEQGCLVPEDLPWVDDPKDLNFMITYSRYAAYDLYYYLRRKKYKISIMIIAAKLRLLFNFKYFIGIERKIRDKISK